MIGEQHSLAEGTAVWVRASVNAALARPQPGFVQVRLSGSFTHMQVPLAGLHAEGGHAPLHEGAEVWVRGQAASVWGTAPGTQAVRIGGFTVLHIAQGDLRESGDFGDARSASQDSTAPPRAA